ncbi:MAG: DNA-binding domain of ModE / Molybdate-binding domain of ModE [Burkholderiaceae bacterium]|jgi:molybdate transport system regulatory protein|nr:MAG: DNA-binding domain of ModE / Molybdate-binding domain of ModE [Burkholderiaceae bacterium]
MAPPRSAAVAIASALRPAVADRRIEILRLIARTGSISQAARDAGVSYKAAWQALDTLTNLAGVPLVERVVGGAGGGGASVTPAGRQLLAAADALAQARTQVLGRLARRGAGSADAPGAASGALADPSGPSGAQTALLRLSLRTSMRNQLPCTVQGRERRGPVVTVRLALGDGTLLASRITSDSAELLELQSGLPVLALCKATAVEVRAQSDADGAPGRHGADVNRLQGRATRVARGAGGDEVAAQLDGGLQLVGFAAPASGLRAGKRVQLLVEPSAVVIARVE